LCELKKKGERPSKKRRPKSGPSVGGARAQAGQIHFTYVCLPLAPALRGSLGRENDGKIDRSKAAWGIWIEDWDDGVLLASIDSLELKWLTPLCDQIDIPQAGRHWAAQSQSIDQSNNRDSRRGPRRRQLPSSRSIEIEIPSLAVQPQQAATQHQVPAHRHTIHRIECEVCLCLFCRSWICVCVCCWKAEEEALDWDEWLTILLPPSFHSIFLPIGSSYAPSKKTRH
jgi:hypothetical protein